MAEIATRAYRSKIGRLPWAVRNDLCERIRDGAPSSELLEWVNKQPVLKGKPQINAQNITDWRGTGYADWLKASERSEHLRKYAETAQHIVSATGGDPTAVGSRILAGKLLDMLEAADEETAIDFANAVAKLRKGEHDAEKLKLESRKADLADENLKLEKEKFRRLTCETFLRWYENKTAAGIAAGSGSNEDKIAALLEYMDKEEARNG